MQTPTTDSPLSLDAALDLTPLRRALQNAGFTQDALAATTAGASRGPTVDRVLVRYRTNTQSPYDTLVRLFTLGDGVSPQSAAAALAPMPVATLQDVGLLRDTPAGVRANLTLNPFGNWLTASDFLHPDQALASDHVLGIGAATMTLATLTVRRPVETALDLGTGCGVQAILASQHARRVIGTDVNPRALQVAAFNARLNGINNLDLRRGSLYEPVADERFDLIVANPPYVISPASRFAFRDSGLAGDAISEQVIRGAVRLLREGGFCTVLFNWHYDDEARWAERPAQWLADAGCDAWIMRHDVSDPLTYATTWLRHNEARDAGDYERELEEWLAYYQQQNIRHLAAGAVILRRRTPGPNWLRSDVIPPGPHEGNLSGQIERIFAAQDLLHQTADDHQLLDARLTLFPGHELLLTLHAEHGAWAAKSARLRLTSGLSFIGDADRMLCNFLLGCNGRRTVRELLAEAAHRADIALMQLTPALLQIVRRMIYTGYLGLADDDSEPGLPPFGIVWPTASVTPKGPLN